MKFLSGLLFAFCVALPTAFAMPPPQYGPPQKEEYKPNAGILDFLVDDDDKEPDPEISCESDPKVGNTQCVPKYRFSDEVDEKSTKKFVKWLEAANKAGADEVLLELNTPGGSVPDGFNMVRAIEDSDAPVTCVVDGDADSMGFYILQACEHRAMTKRSKLMAHEPSIGGSVQGQPNFWKNLSEMMGVERNTLAIHCAHRLKVSLAEYHKRTDGGLAWWMLYDEAKKVGAVDDVVDAVKKLHKDMLHRKKK